MAVKSPIRVQKLWWTRCFGADSPKIQCLCMKPGSRRLKSVSQWVNFHFLLFAVKTISSTTRTWCPSPCLSWACYTNRKVTSTWPSLWYRMPSRFGGFIINIKTNFPNLRLPNGSMWLLFLISGSTTKITTWSPDCTSGSMQRSTAWAHFQRNSLLLAHLLKNTSWVYEGNKPWW